jgi:hypothetical protein
LVATVLTPLLTAVKNLFTNTFQPYVRGRREDFMDDKPVEYLRRAIECSRLSETLPDAIARETFAAMSRVWIKLAAELRRAAALDYGVKQNC